MKILSSRKALAVIITVIFFFMLACNFLTPYQADDFVYHFRFDNGAPVESVADIFPSLKAHAETLNGRLTAHFFVHLFELLPKPVFNIINTFVFIALIVLTAGFICGKRPNAAALLLAFCGVLVFMPAFGEVVLWLDGSINYLWAIVLNLIFLLPYYRLFESGRSISAPFLKAGFVVLAFICGSFQETMSSAALALAVVFMLFIRFFCRRRIDPVFILGAIFSFAGLLFMALQPAELSVKSASVNFASIYHSFLNMMCYFRFFWPLTAVFAIGFTLCVLEHADARRLILCGIFFFGFLCANGVMLLARIYPERCAAPAFVLLLIADGMLIKLLSEFKYRKAVVCLSALLCAVSLFCGISAAGDIASTFAQFKANEAKIIEARSSGSAELYLPELYGYTKYSVAHSMIFPSPIDWVNECMCKYYGVEKIIGYDFYTEFFADLPYQN